MATQGDAQVSASINNSYSNTQSNISASGYFQFGNWYYWGVATRLDIDGQQGVSWGSGASTSPYQAVASVSGSKVVNKGTSTRSATCGVYAYGETVSGYGGISGDSWATTSVTVGQLTSYTISYNGNGTTTNVPSSQTKYHGTNITISSTTPTRSGYIFMKWNTKQDGSGTNYAPGDTYSANETVTLYAQWVSSIGSVVLATDGTFSFDYTSSSSITNCEIGIQKDNGAYSYTTIGVNVKSHKYTLDRNARYRCCVRLYADGKWGEYNYSNYVYTTPLTPNITAINTTNKVILIAKNANSISWYKETIWSYSDDGQSWTTMTEILPRVETSQYHNYYKAIYKVTDGTTSAEYIVEPHSFKDVSFQSNVPIKNVGFRSDVSIKDVSFKTS